MFVRLTAVRLQLFAVGLLATGSAASAIEIAYEGFGYPSGYLAIADGGNNAVDPRKGTATFDGLDDGTAGFLDHDDDPSTPAIQPTKLGDPGRTGGSGTWTTAWTRRDRHPYAKDKANKVNRVNGEATLSYTDSDGNRLATTMGKSVLYQNWLHSWRVFDASSLLDGSLTLANTGIPGRKEIYDYPIPTLGKQGTIVWLSFLADVQVDGQDEAGQPNEGNLAIQFWNKRHNRAGGDHPPDRTAGIIRKWNSDWRFVDDDYHEPVGGKNLGTLPGSGVANDRGPLFMVLKIDYRATTTAKGKVVDDGFADVSFWVNPRLSKEPALSEASRTASTFISFNGLNIYYSGHPNSTSSIDEIRIGTTYQDVAPITASDGGK